MKSRLNRLPVLAPSAHQFYVTLSQLILWIMQIHSWFSRLPPLVLTGFVSLDELFRGRWGRVIKLLQLLFPLQSVLSTHTPIVVQGCIFHTVSKSGTVFRQMWFVLSTECALWYIVPRSHNRCVDRQYVSFRYFLPLELKTEGYARHVGRYSLYTIGIVRWRHPVDFIAQF